MPFGEVPVACAGHHVERAIYSEWNNRQLQFVGKHESSLLEDSHVTSERSCSLRENHNTHSARQSLPCIDIGLLHLARSTLVNKYLMRLLTGISHERNFLQLVFHHPLKVAAKEAIDEEDVESSLMVCHEDIRMSLFEVLPTLHLYWQEESVSDYPSPTMSGIISPKVSVAQRASYSCDEGCQYGGNYCDWKCH